MIRFLLVVAILAFAGPAAAQMYKWIDKDGKVHYSDQPPPADAKQQAAPATSSAPLSAAPAGKFRSEEEAALGAMCGMAILEFMCTLELKRYCTMEELVHGGPGGKPKGFEKDPRSDPNYQYTVTVRGDEIAFAATPRRAGLAGFFNDGNGPTWSPSGPASTSDKRVMGGTNCVGFTK